MFYNIRRNGRQREEHADSAGGGVFEAAGGAGTGDARTGGDENRRGDPGNSAEQGFYGNEA